MPDAELDRLHAVRDLAYQRKQNAYRFQTQALEHLTAARVTMNAAFAKMQSADRAFEASWQRYKSLSNSRRRGAKNRTLANATSDAWWQQERAGHTLNKASEAHDTAKQAYTAARDKLLSAKEAFQSAMDDFKEANLAFQTRLDQLKAYNARRREGILTVAIYVGVPSRYLDKVWVAPRRKGGHNIYFGGVDGPFGHGHGHYAVDEEGMMTYERDPGEPHGAHNFLNPRKKPRPQRQ